MADDGTEASVIEDIQSKVQEASELWKAIGATPIPKTLKEAMENKFELVSDAVEVAALMAYPGEKQDEDSRRVITLEKAIAIIEAYEFALVNKLVTRPDNVLVQIKKFWETWLTRLYDFVKFLWKHPNIRRALWTLFQEAISHILLTISASLIIAQIVKAVESRRSVEGEMRKKALPQRRGPRYVRRKTSRR